MEQQSITPFNEITPTVSTAYPVLTRSQSTVAFTFHGTSSKKEPTVTLEIRVGQQDGHTVAGYAYHVHGDSPGCDFHSCSPSRGRGEFDTAEAAVLSVLVMFRHLLKQAATKSGVIKRKVQEARDAVEQKITTVLDGQDILLASDAESTPEERRAEAEEFMDTIPGRERTLAFSETKTLRMVLTSEREDQLNDEFRNVYLEHKNLAEEKKGIVSDYNGRLKNLSTRMDKLVQTLESGSEERDVRCVWYRDFTNNVRECVRTDTNEVIETVLLSDAERQRELDLDDPDPEEGIGEGTSDIEQPEGEWCGAKGSRALHYWEPDEEGTPKALCKPVLEIDRREQDLSRCRKCSNILNKRGKEE